MMKLRLPLQLYKLYTLECCSDNWMDLNFQQNSNSRGNFVKLTDNLRLRIGKNCIVNRLCCKNTQIDYDWLNLSYETFKIK